MRSFSSFWPSVWPCRSTGISMNTAANDSHATQPGPNQPPAGRGACVTTISRTAPATTVAAQAIAKSMPNDSARFVTLARTPASRASMFTSRMSGSTRIAGPTAQKPTMAPSVFSMRSSTSNRRYGCT